MENNTFKILSIDGGGIKGLYSSRILFQFEEAAKKHYGDPNLRIVDFFDLVCGTSTGGLIALGISARIPMEKIYKFYELKGQSIFPKSMEWWKMIRQTFIGGKYSDLPLRKALQEMFADRRIASSECLLCIPTYDFTHGTYELFKYDHAEGNLQRHNKLRYVDVALATSAAPTYFPLAQIADENNIQYVDGGVWANNPATIGLAEALRYFVGAGKQYGRMELLSVASLNVKAGKAPMLRRHRSFLNWRHDLFNLSLIGQSEFCDYFLSTLKEYTDLPLDYYRIPSPLISGEQSKFIDLDKASVPAYNLMKQYADDMYHRVRHDAIIKKIFTSKKTYQVK